MDVMIATAHTLLREHMLSVTIALPLVGALLIAVLPSRAVNMARAGAVLVSLAALLLAALLYHRVTGSQELQHQEVFSWIPSLGIAYRVGIDGVSALLILLTTVLTFSGVLVSWLEIEQRVKTFFALLLTAEAALIGVFAATDLFLLVIFWDAALIPMTLLIAIYGSGDSTRAAIKFLLFTMTGSMLMLLAILYGGWTVGNFDLIEWYAYRFTVTQQLWLFVAFALAFAVKLPVLGLHTWLPDAHAEAPTAGSVLLAGAFLKMGAYGFYRIAIPMFPAGLAQVQEVVLVVAVAGFVVGALLAMVQTDLKRLIAYSSVAHMGLVLLGLASREEHAAIGAVLQMVAHGVIAAALFVVGSYLFHRKHSRAIADFGGTARAVPLISTCFVLVSFAAMGVPGLAGFAAEFPILLGAFQSVTMYAGIALMGVVLMASCFLWVIMRVFFGPLRHEEERKWPDLQAGEAGAVALLILAIVVMGVWPQPLARLLERPAHAFVILSKRVEMVIPAFPQPPRTLAQEQLQGIASMPPQSGSEQEEVAPEVDDVNEGAATPEMIEEGGDRAAPEAVPQHEGL